MTRFVTQPDLFKSLSAIARAKMAKEGDTSNQTCRSQVAETWTIGSCTTATAFLVYLQSLDYCFHFFSHDTENTCYAVWLTSEKMWLSIIQICNCWNKKMCMFFFIILYILHIVLWNQIHCRFYWFSRAIFFCSSAKVRQSQAHI